MKDDTPLGSPLIFIITACFNAKGFIEQTILSVLDQTYPLIEYLIIDGGSKDGTVEINRKYVMRTNTELPAAEGAVQYETVAKYTVNFT